MQAVNFSIKSGIYLVADGRDLDLHNDYDFVGHTYDKTRGVCELTWKRCEREGVSRNLPSRLVLRTEGVRSFMTNPRNPEMPPEEDLCLASFGYVSDEEWGRDQFWVEDVPQPSWKWSFLLMSEAEIVIDAEHAVLEVVP